MCDIQKFKNIYNTSLLENVPNYLTWTVIIFKFNRSWEQIITLTLKLTLELR